MKNITSNDTVTCDSASVADFLNNRAYQYTINEEEQESNWFDSFMHDILSFDIPEEYMRPITIILFIILFIALSIIIAYKFNLFSSSSKRTAVDFDDSLDFHGIDFNQLIGKAEKEGNYREAARLTYLLTLKRLDESKVIKWTLYNTPEDYGREANIKDFSKMTRIFIRFRYGEENVDKETYDRMKSMAEETNKAAKDKIDSVNK